MRDVGHELAAIALKARKLADAHALAVEGEEDDEHPERADERGQREQRYRAAERLEHLLAADGDGDGVLAGRGAFLQHRLAAPAVVEDAAAGRADAQDKPLQLQRGGNFAQPAEVLGAERRGKSGGGQLRLRPQVAPRPALDVPPEGHDLRRERGNHRGERGGRDDGGHDGEAAGWVAGGH